MCIHFPFLLFWFLFFLASFSLGNMRWATAALVTLESYFFFCLGHSGAMTQFKAQKKKIKNNNKEAAKCQKQSCHSFNERAACGRASFSLSSWVASHCLAFTFDLSSVSSASAASAVSSPVPTVLDFGPSGCQIPILC